MAALTVDPLFWLQWSRVGDLGRWRLDRCVGNRLSRLVRGWGTARRRWLDHRVGNRLLRWVRGWGTARRRWGVEMLYELVDLLGDVLQHAVLLLALFERGPVVFQVLAEIVI